MDTSSTASLDLHFCLDYAQSITNMDIQMNLEDEFVSKLKSLESKIFSSGSIITESGHTMSFDQTYEFVKPLFKHIPITRLSDLTPLDYLGIPVWSAVTPLAKDLKVHAGKGVNSMAAKLSAVMEAIERVSAETTPDACIVYSSYNKLKIKYKEIVPISPNEFNLPFETKYHPDKEVGWVPAYDIIQKKCTLIAADLAFTPPQDGILTSIETNGLASGNSLTEAIVHALYELIERDAISESEFYDLFGNDNDKNMPEVRMIHLDSVPKSAYSLINRLERQNQRVYIRDLTSDIDIPVFNVILVDSCFPGQLEPVAFSGYGADLVPERAIFRALTESAQSHTSVMVGARETFESTQVSSERLFTLKRRLSVYKPLQYQKVSTFVETSNNILSYLNEILNRLQLIGIKHCIVADLTRLDFRVPVVRVIIPEFSQPYGSTSKRPSLRLLRKIVL